MNKIIKNSFVFKLLKGVFYALIVTLILILISALIMSFAGSSGVAVKLINCAIRLLAVGICTYFTCDGKGGIVKGLISGVVTFFAVYMLTVVLGNTFKIDYAFLIDLVCSAIFGVVYGIIFVNLKKDSNNG